MATSLIDKAFEFVKKCDSSVSFKTIWEEVSKDLSEEEKKARVAQFYTNLSLDGRFVTLGENEWDLRERVKFEKVHIDMKDVYADIEVSLEDDDKEEEEGEEDKVFQNEEESEDGEEEKESSEEEDLA